MKWGGVGGGVGYSGGWVTVGRLRRCGGQYAEGEIVSENETIQTRANNKTDIDSREVGHHIKAKMISLSSE